MAVPLSPHQFGPHNDDPSLPHIMAGRQVSMEDIPLDRVLGGVTVNKAKARRYAALPTEIPPVVAIQKKADDPYVVLEGNHRAEAARLRGMTHIKGWVGR